jgi:hypothetical protein
MAGSVGTPPAKKLEIKESFRTLIVNFVIPVKDRERLKTPPRRGKAKYKTGK